MISFDLKCGLGHVFEAWFRSSMAYEEQRDADQIACPFCGDTRIGKAVMAPAVGAKGNQRDAVPAPAQMVTTDAPPTEEQIRAVLHALVQAQARSLEQSQWVGDSFTERARAMHYGEEDQAPIHGTANLDDARAMIEEGLAVAPLLVPVAPPDQTH